MQIMLNFEEFQSYTNKVLREHLPEELSDAEITIKAVTKNNGLVLHGISVLPEGSKIAPNIYLESYFRDYENAAKLGDVIDSIANTVINNVNVPSNINNIAYDFMDFET